MLGLMSFKVGDPVQLKHGGQAMTVTEVNDDDVTCTWHDDHQSAKYNVYPSAALQPYHGNTPLPPSRR
jgi:uncharacterized protein YodC (DUF2158 family)